VVLSLRIGHDSRRYVIYAPHFNDTTGGVIVLHYLCHLLNQMGCQASIWPSKKTLPDHRPSTWLRALGYWFKQHIFRRYRTGPGFNCPIATRADLEGAIVVYPEVIADNPLRAKHVVRWILFKPENDFSDRDRYAGEMHFCFQKAFNTEKVQCPDEHIFMLRWWQDGVYEQTHWGERQGTCYLRRKGKDVPISHDLTDSICIDDLSHSEKAKVFNQRKYLVSYDPYTTYVHFAVVCGCIPVIVPLEGVSKEQWRPEVEMRYGLAYGWDDVPWAVQTRQNRLDWMAKSKAEDTHKVHHFVTRTQTFFEQHEH
jgi:hypothetical protein